MFLVTLLRLNYLKKKLLLLTSMKSHQKIHDLLTLDVTFYEGDISFLQHVFVGPSRVLRLKFFYFLCYHGNPLEYVNIHPVLCFGSFLSVLAQILVSHQIFNTFLS